MAQSVEVRLTSGDVSRRWLRAHQVVLACEDAEQLGVRNLQWVVLDLARESSTAACIFECIIDRAPNATVARGELLVPRWFQESEYVSALDQMQLYAVKHLERPGAWHELRRVEVAVVDAFPSRMRHARKSHEHTTAAAFASSAVWLLPEAVQCGHLKLERALERQWSSVYRHVRLRRGQVLPVRLLNELFVCQVVDITTSDQVDGKASEVEEYQGVQVVVRGLGQVAENGTEEATQERTQLCSQMANLSLHNATSQHELDELLWRMGCVGYNSLLSEVLLLVQVAVADNTVSTKASLMGKISGILLTGAAGVGKSKLLEAVSALIKANDMASHVQLVDCSALLLEWEASKTTSGSGSAVGAFELLERHLRPNGRQSLSGAAVLLIDDVDLLFRSDATGVDDDEGEQSGALAPLGSALLRLMDSPHRRLCVIGSTGRAPTLSSKARQSNRFAKTLDMIVPTESMRRMLLSRLLYFIPVGKPDISHEVDDNFLLRKTESDVKRRVGSHVWALAARLASMTGGYVAKDLVRIVRKAMVSARGNPIAWHHLAQSQQQIQPSQLRELNVASPANATAIPFAGYCQLRKEIRNLVSWRFHPTEAMKALGISEASGILLHGPSGCGKSLLARKIAAEANANFISVKSSDLMSKYFGDSEKAVRALFERARGAAPCILFFDEFDAIVQKRSFGADGDDGGGRVHARVLSTFLNEMDGVGARGNGATSAQSGGVLILAATNRLDALDAALIRPGRIDKVFELGYPGAADIQEMLICLTRRFPLQADVDLAQLAQRSTGTRPFTGADIAAICKEAALGALRVDLDAKVIQMEHLITAWDERARSST